MPNVTAAETPKHPIFAAFYGLLVATCDKKAFGKLRTYLTRHLANQRVLEIGCGTGANFAYYPESAVVTATEPDPHMMVRAQKHLATLHRPNITVTQVDGQQLPYRSAEFDAVVVTLVLCTIPDAEQSLREIHRVLRPGGKLYFLEHVEAQSPLWRRTQVLMNPVWHKLFAGCSLTRASVTAIKNAGFSVIELASSATPLTPWLPFSWGIAERLQS